MKKHRVWIEIALLVAGVACALALLIASLGAAAAAGNRLSTAPSNSSPAEHVYEGIVTCSRCGAKHSAAMGYTAEACVRICVHGGAHFALVNADATYFLEGDPGVLKKLAGQRARVIGSLSGNTLRVAAAAAES